MCSEDGWTGQLEAVGFKKLAGEVRDSVGYKFNIKKKAINGAEVGKLSTIAGYSSKIVIFIK